MKAALFKKYLNPVFVETGTFEGDGVEAALLVGFDRIISLDITVYPNAPLPQGRRLPKKVDFWVADSSTDLYDIIKDIDCKITFWLDAHLNNCCTGTPFSRQCPVLKEIKQIERHPIKNHTILIDDVRLFETVYFDRITIGQVQKAILRINDKYVFSYDTVRPKYKNDVMVATVGA